MRPAPCPLCNDFHDRLTGVSGAYSNSYAYNTLGNLTSFEGVSYTYGSKPHAVDLAGPYKYNYDANGNLTSDNTSRARTLTWDAENRPVSIVASGVTTTFVYDGGGKRVKKTVNNVTTLYVNQFFERNLSTGENTTSYFFGGKLVAQRVGSTLGFMHADHLGSTAVTTGSSGTVTGTLRYAAFGSTRSGSVSTDIRFTGQRSDDSTGLYFYNARYYDPELGRFVSADAVVPSPGNPQSLNRYSYCLNNPLKYIDPSGHDEAITDGECTVILDRDGNVREIYSSEGGISGDVWTLIEAYRASRDTESTYTSGFEKSNEINVIIEATRRGSGGQTDTVGSKISINMDTNEFNTGNNLLNILAMVRTLQHEFVHASIAGPNTVENEVKAYQHQLSVGNIQIDHNKQLSSEIQHSLGFASQFAYVNLAVGKTELITQLVSGGARSILHDAGYRSMIYLNDGYGWYSARVPLFLTWP
jgi:RHS repeat-associated protein